ncbi:MAG: hypothetical protein LUC91_00770 [Prevotella sp.]|nr:hypothetical protein [Prevotella sp.]
MGEVIKMNECLERKVYSTYAELADDMVKLAIHGKTSVAVLFYEDAIEMLKELLLFEDVNAKSVVINEPEYDGYGYEYYITLDDEFNIYIEPAWHEEFKFDNGKVTPEGYYGTAAYKFFIDGEANSAILKKLEEGEGVEIEFLFKESSPLEDLEIPDGLTEEDWKILLDNTKLIQDEDGEITGIALDIFGILAEFFK